MKMIDIRCCTVSSPEETDHHHLFSSLLCVDPVCTQGLKMSVLWTMFYGLMSAFAPIYGWILFLRALVGFGIGGAPQS